MRRAVTVPALFLAVFMLGGCALIGIGQRGSSPIPVEVNNNFGDDITVWALSETQPTRLGSVTGLGSEHMRIPAGATSTTRPPYTLALLVLPHHNGGSYVTGTLAVSPGDTILLNVGSTLNASSWDVIRPAR